MKLFSLFFIFILFGNCAMINEYIECENNRDKMYPSAVSNCTQSEKELNSKTDPTIVGPKR